MLVNDSQTQGDSLTAPQLPSGSWSCRHLSQAGLSVTMAVNKLPDDNRRKSDLIDNREHYSGRGGTHGRQDERKYSKWSSQAFL